MKLHSNSKVIRFFQVHSLPLFLFLICLVVVLLLKLASQRAQEIAVAVVTDDKVDLLPFSVLEVLLVLTHIKQQLQAVALAVVLVDARVEHQLLVLVHHRGCHCHIIMI